MFYSKDGTQRKSKDMNVLPTTAVGGGVQVSLEASPREKSGKPGHYGRTKPGSHAHQRWYAQYSKSRVIFGVIVGLLVLHVLGASYFAPRMVSRVAERDGGTTKAGLYNFITSFSPIDTSGSSFKSGAGGDSFNRRSSTSQLSQDAGALVSRLSKKLSDTAATLNLHHLHTLLESQNSEAAILGGDINKVLRIRDGLTNPLNKLPVSPGEIDAMKGVEEQALWERWIKVHTAPPLVTLFEEKCNAENSAENDDKEFVLSSRSWVKRYGNDVVKYKWCRGGKAEEVPDLERVLILRSNRALPPNAVTIVTQLSIERLAMLEQQCAHWPHPIAAVVYIPLLKGKISSTEDESWNGASLEVGIEEVKRYAERMKTSKCIIDVELVVEERCTFEQATLYPTNAVRNRPLVMSRSDIVLLLDVDFVVDQSLALDLEDETRHGELTDTLASGAAIVLPAFEAWDQGDRGKKIALTAAKEGKQFIAKKFMYNVVMGFHVAHYPQGHEPTLFWKWINTTEPYEIKHETGFEPYILMLKEHVPYYDERFRGYYFNKVEQLLHISTQLELPFVVHPTSFVVHVPHPKAKTKWRTKRSGQKERNHAMFLDAMEDIKLKRFVPVTSFPHLCLPPEIQLSVATAIELGAQSQGAEEQVAMIRRFAHDVHVDDEDYQVNFADFDEEDEGVDEGVDEGMDEGIDEGMDEGMDEGVDENVYQDGDGDAFEDGRD